MRVVRRFGAAAAASLSAGPVAGDDAPSGDESAADAFARVDVRRFGAGASLADSVASGDAADRVDVRRRGVAAAEPDAVVASALVDWADAAGFRRVVARRFGASSVEGTSAAVASPASSCAAAAPWSADRESGRLGAAFGDWASWARSSSWSSSGTSLHGSLERAGRSA